MKRYLLLAALLMAAICPDAGARDKKCNSFREALVEQKGSNVSVKSASVLANAGDLLVVSDGDIAVFAKTSMPNLKRGDHISLEGTVDSNQWGFPIINCLGITLIASGQGLPAVEYTEISLIADYSAYGVAIPVTTEGLFIVRGPHSYIYMPDQMNNRRFVRAEVVYGQELAEKMSVNESVFMRINGYLLNVFPDEDIPKALVLLADVLPQPAVNIKAVSSLPSLENGRVVRIMTTLSSIDSTSLELCDFSGSLKLNQAEMINVALGQRVMLTVSKGDAGLSIDGIKFYKGKPFSEDLQIEKVSADGKLYEIGLFEKQGGCYLYRGLALGSGESFAVQASGQDRISWFCGAYKPDSYIPLTRTLTGERPAYTCLPKGEYDVYYFPEAEAVVLHSLNDPGIEGNDEEAIPLQLVEQKPSFNGGNLNEFSKWVNSQLIYPECAKAKGIQGQVMVQFIVEADGQVTNVKVLVGAHPLLDNEAVRVVASSPQWMPGKQGDSPIRVLYTMPIQFQLR